MPPLSARSADSGGTFTIRHPDCLTAGLLADVLAVAGTGRFLPYDHRWSGCKDEHVFARDICQGQVRQPPSYEGVGVTDGVAQVDAAELTDRRRQTSGMAIRSANTSRVASRRGPGLTSSV